MVARVYRPGWQGRPPSRQHRPGCPLGTLWAGGPCRTQTAGGGSAWLATNSGRRACNVSALAILNVFLVFLPSGDIVQVVLITEVWLTPFFIIDFVRRLKLAEDRRAYLVGGHGWLDLISAFPFLRILRALRIGLTLRLFRRVGGPDEFVRAYFADRAAGGLFLVLFLAILVMEFGSLSVLWAERDAPAANIVSADDAVWYTIVTIATVGYGDQHPVTDLGRILGSIIIVIGVGVFGTLTGYLAQAFIRPAPAAAVTSHLVDATAPVAPSALGDAAAEATLATARMSAATPQGS
jgi:voltage-gated potassium channel